MGGIALALVAGVLSTLSPCVLPLLPIVIGAAIGQHRLGPAALAAGLALSFVVIGLFAATIGFSAGLDQGVFHSVAAVLLILVGANALGAVTDVLAQTLIQLAVPSGLRGRAGGAWVVSIGMAPLGQFQVGALASLFGVSAALGVNGVALMAVGLAAALLVPRLRRL